MRLAAGVAVDVVLAEALGRHVLNLTFSDGHVATVDFGPFLKNVLNAETRQFLNVKRFRAFRLVYGNVVWGDYEMCFPIEDLYRGRVCAKSSVPVLAVAETRAEYGVLKRKRRLAILSRSE
jgi:hypothetical protein